MQLRNQKLIEVAPSPTLNQNQRKKIIDAAVSLAKTLNYKGLGTFEFLVDGAAPDNFFFLEINPRIQVEHTVTEEITGLDLVEKQILISQGRSISNIELHPEQKTRQTGFAIQARLCAETIYPDQTRILSTGTLKNYRIPGGRGVRVDDCLFQGLTPLPAFDSLLAKIIVHHDSYPKALIATPKMS